MKTHQDIELLNRIERVAPPDDLYDRIQDRIKSLRKDKLSMAWTFTASIAFALMVTVNAYLLTSSSPHQGDRIGDIEVVAQDMNMNFSNQLYHD